MASHQEPAPAITKPFTLEQNLHRYNELKLIRVTNKVWTGRINI